METLKYHNRILDVIKNNEQLICDTNNKDNFVFGRYDIMTSFPDNIKINYNILNIQDWCEKKNNDFIKCALNSTKKILLFFTIGSGVLYNNIKDIENRLVNDLQRSIKCLCTNQINCSCECSNTKINYDIKSLSQFTIELLQIQYAGKLHVLGPRYMWQNKNIIYFELTDSKNKNQIWTNILNRVLSLSIYNYYESCKIGGSTKKIHILGKSRVVYKSTISNGKHIKMIKNKGFIVPIKFVQSYKKSLK